MMVGAPACCPLPPGPSSAPRPAAQGSGLVVSCEPCQEVLCPTWSNTSQAHPPTGEAGAPHRRETSRAARGTTPRRTAEGRPAGGTSGKGLGFPAPPVPRLGRGRGPGIAQHDVFACVDGTWHESVDGTRPTVSGGRRRLPGHGRPNRYWTTPALDGHRQRLQLLPDTGLRFLKCYCPPKTPLRALLGRSPGRVAGSCRAALEMAGAAVQSGTSRAGRAAASPSRPRAPRTVAQVGRRGRRLRGTALRAPSRGTTPRARDRPNAAVPQV